MPDRRRAGMAKRNPRQAGVKVKQGVELRLREGTQRNYKQSPWSDEVPIEDTLKPKIGAPYLLDEQPESSARGRTPRKLASRVFAAPEALKAAKLWEDACAEGLTTMPSAGGNATGTVWTS